MKTAFLCVTLTALSACTSTHTSNDTDEQKKAMEYYSSTKNLRYPSFSEDDDVAYSVEWYIGHPSARHEMLTQCQKNGFEKSDCKHARLAAIKSHEIDPLKGK